jgi:hypothetical protein
MTAPESQRQNETDSLRLERDALLAALEKIAGGWVDDDISEEDDERFVVALQKIARAALTASKVMGERS